MKTLIQKYYRDGELLMEVTHIYSETGYFVRVGDTHPQGWHIQLGTSDSADNYNEVPGSESHNVPAFLPDIELPPEPEEDGEEQDISE